MKSTGRKIQKEQTKKLLIETAYQIFSERGILNTRMSDIAQAANVSHGTVFLHFSTQEELITEVIEAYCGKIAARTHELAETSVTLRDLLAAHLSGIGEYEPLYIRLVIENRLLPLSARDAWIQIQSAVSFHFSQAIEQEEKKNALVPIPAYLLFNMWTGMIHYYLANSDLFAPDGKVIERYGEFLISNYLQMVCCDPVMKKEG